MCSGRASHFLRVHVAPTTDNAAYRTRAPRPVPVLLPFHSQRAVTPPDPRARPGPHFLPRKPWLHKMLLPELSQKRRHRSGLDLRLNLVRELLSNTTYRISLGDAIGDLNENNAYPNLQFVWSTGPYIDSLSLQGSVVPSKKTPFDKLNVWLVPAGTDTVSTPVFSGTPDKEGNFSFAYMPARTFDVLVFEFVELGH